MAFVKMYGKLLGWILAIVMGIFISVMSARINAGYNKRDAEIVSLKDRVDCIEKNGLTREDIRSELNTFKLQLIEDGMIIVPNRNRSKNSDE